MAGVRSALAGGGGEPAGAWTWRNGGSGRREELRAWLGGGCGDGDGESTACLRVGCLHACSVSFGARETSGSRLPSCLSFGSDRAWWGFCEAIRVVRAVRVVHRSRFSRSSRLEECLGCLGERPRSGLGPGDGREKGRNFLRAWCLLVPGALERLDPVRASRHWFWRCVACGGCGRLGKGSGFVEGLFE